MVRSEPTPQRPPGTDDVLVTIVEIAARLSWTVIKFEIRLILWAVLFPMLTAPSFWPLSPHGPVDRPPQSPWQRPAS